MQADRALSGKVALVTGGGRGIGAAIARGFAAAGARVWVAARTAAEIEKVTEAIRRGGGDATAVACDVTDAAAVEAALKRVGALDILVVNAGLSTDQAPLEHSNPERFRETVEVNLFGAYHVMRLAIPHLRSRGGGKIIAIGSGLGHSSRYGTAAYSCSKAALWMLVRIAAEELREAGIAVNELTPGLVRTQMQARDALSRRDGDVLGEEWLKDPEDVVPLALFLATQPPLGPTGQSFSLMRRSF
jgi:3-oxoacyl-[acyl-carrier protein] reductase